jgi:hypothetical protein
LYKIIGIVLALNVVQAQAIPYKSLSACDKQKYLWKEIEKTEYRELPPLSEFGVSQLLKMGIQNIKKKRDIISDFAPKGWKKYLHHRAAMAQVKLIPKGDHNYTGAFEGHECGLIRLSLTFRPTKNRDVAPGLALKLLRDGQESANISALYLLEGQKKNYNFFENPLSNIVPIADGVGPKLVHLIFKKATDYPEELLLKRLANYNEKGTPQKESNAPRQIFFIPNPELSFSKGPHDFRQDILKIPQGTKLYEMRAYSDKSYNYSDYKPQDIPSFINNSELLGEIVTTSEFIASQFGDTGIFFNHELR